MRLYFSLLVMALLCVGFSGAVLANGLLDKQLHKAEQFVDNLAQDAIGFLADDSLSFESRTKKFEDFLGRKFDMRSIGRFAMGKYWRSLPAEQQEEYLDLFEKRVIGVYSRRFKEYEGQTLIVLSSRAEGKRDVIVTTSMSQPSGPDVRLDWRVRYNDGQFKVIDVIVEGVSMALTQRSDFASVIQRGGGDVSVLISHLGQE